MAYRCKWCGGAARDRDWTLRERMYGTGSEHRYEECGDCHSLQIAEPVPDLAPYYPAEYGAHGPARVHAGIRRLFRLVRARLANATGFAGDGALAGWLHLPAILAHVRGYLPADRAARILDVGCGAGHGLLHLADLGYTRLHGVDPWIGGDLAYANGVVVWKRNIRDVEGEFDLVMAHHSLEHVPDPGLALVEMRRLLAPGGRLLVRLPVIGGEAWRRYAECWVQLDPPRHLSIPSRKGFEAAASAAGLTLRATRFDSTGFQFWGSELTRRGIPLIPKAGGRAGPAFSRAELRGWRNAARELNRRGAGDQALFVLDRSPPLT